MRRFLSLLILSAPLVAASPPTLLDILSAELDRNFNVLKQKADPPPYYMAYEVTEVESQSLSGTLGLVNSRDKNHTRYLDITVRVGSPKLDNYRMIKGQRARFTSGSVIALDDVPAAIARRIWLETDRTYRLAARRLIEIKSNQQTSVQQNDDSDDFSSEPPSVRQELPPPLGELGPEWATRLRKWSGQLSNYPGVLNSVAGLAVERETKYLVNTEGTRLVHGRNFATLQISASGKAADGMDLGTNEDFQGFDLSRLPKAEVIEAAVTRVGNDLSNLLRAPVVEPFVGPAILSGGAAGVFFHEIFGHRVEGHRQKDEVGRPDVYESRGSAGAAGFSVGDIRSHARRPSDQPI